MAEQAVQVELVVLAYHRWQEEDQAPARLEEEPRESNEVGRKPG